jgi:hypothetical protein
MTNQQDELSTRLNAIEDNVEWLRNHDPAENQSDALHRLKLMEADIDGIMASVAKENPEKELGEELLQTLLGGDRDE